MELEIYFVSLAALAGLVTVVAQFAKKLFPDFFVDFKAQLLSWVLAVALVFIGWTADLGFLADVESILQVVLYGVGVGLISNGIFDIAVVKSVLGFIFSMLDRNKSETNG